MGWYGVPPNSHFGKFAMASELAFSNNQNHNGAQRSCLYYPSDSRYSVSPSRDAR
jgi:hypothetical protein